MREKRNNQIEFDFQPPSLALTSEYYNRYETISRVIDDTSKIIDLVHRDLKKLLKRKAKSDPGRKCEFSSDTVLRIIVVQRIEGTSLRDTVVRIDDSKFLRRFVRIYNGPMMGHTTLCTLRNAISAKTWKKINAALTEAAVGQELISGERARLDTTLSETNIHWPTDSSLLWDTYRVIARIIEKVRDLDPEAVGDRRLQVKRAKKLHTKIARRSGKKGSVSKKAKETYKDLIGLVGGVLDWADDIATQLSAALNKKAYEYIAGSVENLVALIRHFHSLGLKVLDQARRRVLEGEQVPNDEKIFSIFEPHTELIKRGKAGRSVEFGHMLSIYQVEEKFIIDYDVFKKKPIDYDLVDPALERHRELFGELPQEFSADKGFYESMEKIKELESEIEVVSIGKKGSRTQQETERETSREYKQAQKFRAGVEGTISYLKRLLGMWRCVCKGWEHFVTTVASTIFTHNLLVLARGYG